MLLLLLLSLAALSHLSDGDGSFIDNAVIDSKTCPINFFGRLYTTLYVQILGGKIGICFKGMYSTRSQNDCIVMPQGDIDIGRWWIRQSPIRPGSVFHKALPQLTGTAPCFTGVKLYDGSVQRAYVTFTRYDEQQVVVSRPYSGLRVLVADVFLDGIKLQQWNVAFGSPEYFQDVSGCRHSGALLLPNTRKCDTGSSVIKCSASAVLSNPRCNSGRCEGDGQCKAICTVTGSTVIDFGGHAASVPDRCAYTLMSEPGVKLMGFFQDRHRKDVSFLDHMILRLDGPAVNIHLGQGGSIQLNDTKLSLGSSPLLRHGVELSKDKTGVTAKLMNSSYNTSVFFDGYTAHIHRTVPAGPAPQGQGLCGSQSLVDVKLSQYSSSGCETQYPDTADSRINCAAMTKRCNLLKEAPFTSCHNHTSPEPYITACTNTLCKYPAVDGLSCQFLEAYARTCPLQINSTMEDWRSKVNCSSPKAFCQDTFCSAHEFCAEDKGGQTGCVCRALFASKYRSTGTLGEPNICGHNSASVTLVGCLMKEKDIDHSVLHLNDETCKGQLDNETNMVTFSFDSSNTCGTVVTANSSHIIYKNTIMSRNSSNFGLITRQDQVNIDMSCFYSQPDMKSMAFKIKDSSVIQQLVSGAWNYTLTMKAYTDASRTQAVESSTEIKLQQTVWVELKTDGLDGKLVAVVTDSCWATNQPSPSGSLKYDLVIAGCSNPADQTVKVVNNGLGTSNYFSFSMFQFSGKTGDVYLHCKLNLCVKKNNTCKPSCSGVKRGRRSVRSQYKDEHSAFITMAWTN